MELVYNVLIANWTPNYSTYSSNYLNIYLGNITNIFMYFTFENIAGKVQFSFFKLSFKFFLYKKPNNFNILFISLKDDPESTNN